MASPKRNAKRNRAGVSLLELMVVVSIGSTLTLGVTSMMNAINRSMKKTEQSLISMTEESLGMRILWFDLSRGGPSFNLLSVGPCGGTERYPADFYDYIPDVPCLDTEENQKNPNRLSNEGCKRFVHLAGPNDDTEVEAADQLTLAMTVRGPTSHARAISPLDFYDAGKAPSLSQSGTLTFQMDRLKDRLSQPASQSLMKEGTILHFYSPVTMRRPLASTAMTSYQNPPRLAGVVAVVKNNEIDQTKPSWLPCTMHPTMNIDLMEGASTYEPLDRFFRLMPPVGGMGAFGMVRPLEIVRYRVETVQHKAKTTGQLVREKFDPVTNAWVSKMNVALGVKSVDFVRKSVSIPSIVARITVDKDAF